MVLPKHARDKDISKKILKASLEQYLQMGADIIEVTAGLSKGAYVWARHGFVAIKPSQVKRILQKAKNELKEKVDFEVVEAIYKHYYESNPGGTEFPIKNWADLPFMKDVLMDPESEWKGRLYLKNKEQLRKFEEYVTRQKK